MSADLGKCCSIILKQIFGDVVQQVGDCLFCSTARTLGVIVKTTGLSRGKVKLALAMLIKYQLVTFRKSSINPNIAEYSINPQHVLYMQRYSRYVELISTKFGRTGAAITSKILKEGSACASLIILNCLNAPHNFERPEKLRDAFNQLVAAHYLIRVPYVKKSAEQIASSSKALKRKIIIDDNEDPVPELGIEPHELYQTSEVDFQWIQAQQKESNLEPKPKDMNNVWKINHDRFHQDFRDELFIGAIERKLGKTAGQCMQYILQQMYEHTDPWQRDTSNPITLNEIKQRVDKFSNNLDLIKYLDQYITLIAEDSLGFIRKTGDMGGGQYVVELEHSLLELTLACIESVIRERFGSKATRIFRVVRLKKNIEQEDLQKEAMIPAKEAKLLAYNLFKEQFLHLRTIRKAGGGGSGPAKAFYLFHIRTKWVAKMLLDMCYKALYNDLTCSQKKYNDNSHLIEKSDKMECIVDAMRERNESEEAINDILDTLTLPEREILEKVKKHLKMLARAEIALDDTIFLLEMFMYHSTIAVYNVAPK